MKLWRDCQGVSSLDNLLRETIGLGANTDDQAAWRSYG